MARIEFESYADFWRYYLSVHRNPTNRRLHFVGTNLVVVVLIAAAVLRDARLLVLLPVVGYGFAWFGHFFVERNRPAQRVLWALYSDFRMCALMWRGALEVPAGDTPGRDPAEPLA